MKQPTSPKQHKGIFLDKRVLRPLFLTIIGLLSTNLSFSQTTNKQYTYLGLGWARGATVTTDLNSYIGKPDHYGSFGNGSAHIRFNDLHANTSGYLMRRGTNIDFYTHRYGGGTNLAMSLTGYGNVGIGTATPASRLTVGPAPQNGYMANIRSYSVATPNEGNPSGGLGAFGGAHAAVTLGELDGIAVIGGTDSELMHTKDLVLNLNGGNVGVGTHKAISKLSIGDAPFNVSHKGADYNLRSYSLSNTAGWAGAGAFGGNSTNVVLGQLDGKAHLAGHDNTLNVWTDLIINNREGNVGIGTSSPTEKLDINGTVNATGFKLNQHSIPWRMTPDKDNSRNNLTFLTHPTTADNDGGFMVIHTEDEAPVIGNQLGDHYNLFVTQGIVTPDYAITLVDKWEEDIPDYVFEEAYKLTPLAEVEAYVKKHKHLPNVAGINDMKANHNMYSVGDMLMGQLKNLEEQVLHTIAQHKEIETLKKENKELHARLDRLEKLIMKGSTNK